MVAAVVAVAVAARHLQLVELLHHPEELWEGEVEEVEVEVEVEVRALAVRHLAAQGELE